MTILVWVINQPAEFASNTRLTLLNHFQLSREVGGICTIGTRNGVLGTCEVSGENAFGAVIERTAVCWIEVSHD